MPRSLNGSRSSPEVVECPLPHSLASDNQSVPKSGRAVPMRNGRTGAAWLVSFDYREGTYWHEPQGNLRHIRRPYASHSVEPNLEPAGTH